MPKRLCGLKILQMSFVVYMLKCIDGSLYIGSTNNIQKRVHQHNFLKSGARYTKQRRPVKLVYAETYITLREARQREYQLKCFTRKKRLMLIPNFQQHNL